VNIDKAFIAKDIARLIAQSGGSGGRRVRVTFADGSGVIVKSNQYGYGMSGDECMDISYSYDIEDRARMLAAIHEAREAEGAWWFRITPPEWAYARTPPPSVVNYGVQYAR
jgi:hypothetical protein